MSGHGGIQERGAGKMCSLPRGSVLYRSVYWAEQECSGLSSPGVTVSGSLVLALWLTRSYMKILGCAEPGVGLSSPLALASHREQGREVSLPVKNHPGLPRPRVVRRASCRQCGALQVPGRD